VDIKKMVSDLPWVNDTVRRSNQHLSLLRVADHEQGKILQPLICNIVAFERTLGAQQITELLPFLPQRMSAFSTVCDVPNAELKSVITDGKLYN
jgi:hypothetical protein